MNLDAHLFRIIVDEPDGVVGGVRISFQLAQQRLAAVPGPDDDGPAAGATLPRRKKLEMESGRQPQGPGDHQQEDRAHDHDCARQPIEVQYIEQDDQSEGPVGDRADEPEEIAQASVLPVTLVKPGGVEDQWSQCEIEQEQFLVAIGLMDHIQPDEVETQHHGEEIGQENRRNIACDKQEFLAVLEQTVHPGDDS